MTTDFQKDSLVFAQKCFDDTFGVVHSRLVLMLHLYETDGSFRPVCQEHDERQLDHGNLRCDGLCLRRYAHFLRSSSG